MEHPLDALTLSSLWTESHSLSRRPTVSLGDRLIRVPPVHRWPLDALEALCRRDFETWAHRSLSGRAYEAWCEAAPTLDECLDFFAEWEELTGQDLGQITTIMGLLEGHVGRIEADIGRWYPGRSLKELFRGSMSFRELWTFIQGLPWETWTQTHIRDKQEEEGEPPTEGPPEFGPWALINYQTAVLTDAVKELEVTLARCFGNEWEDPDPTPRPGLKRLARGIADSAEAEAARRYLDEFNRGAVTPE